MTELAFRIPPPLVNKVRLEEYVFDSAAVIKQVVAALGSDDLFTRIQALGDLDEVRWQLRCVAQKWAESYALENAKILGGTDNKELLPARTVLVRWLCALPLVAFPAISKAVAVKLEVSDEFRSRARSAFRDRILTGLNKRLHRYAVIRRRFFSDRHYDQMLEAWLQKKLHLNRLLLTWFGRLTKNEEFKTAFGRWTHNACGLCLEANEEFCAVGLSNLNDYNRYAADTGLVYLEGLFRHEKVANLVRWMALTKDMRKRRAQA